MDCRELNPQMSDEMSVMSDCMGPEVAENRLFITLGAIAVIVGVIAGIIFLPFLIGGIALLTTKPRTSQQK